MRRKLCATSQEGLKFEETFIDSVFPAAIGSANCAWGSVRLTGKRVQ